MSDVEQIIARIPDPRAVEELVAEARDLQAEISSLTLAFGALGLENTELQNELLAAITVLHWIEGEKMQLQRQLEAQGKAFAACDARYQEAKRHLGTCHNRACSNYRAES